MGLAVWAILSAARDLSIRVPADVSLVFLIIPTMILMLIPLIIFAGIAYALFGLNRNTPGYMLQLQNLADQMKEKVRSVSDKAAEPVIRLKSRNASMQVLKRKKIKN